ncbi:MAG: hypothetical protein ACXADW_17530 [Candidatus Hodarchaeales archaeon]|jgi:hypothetical protein
MKVLCENNMNYGAATNLINCLNRVAHVAVLGDATNMAKALNEFKPDLLLIKSQNVDAVVNMYCKQNNAKVVAFGDSDVNPYADMVFTNNVNLAKDQDKVFIDVPLSDLNVLNRRDTSVEKLDTSIFVSSNINNTCLVDFLCRNYNVKVYGDVKIKSPKYLGKVTVDEKIEILNQSKFVIDFGTYDYINGLLLEAYPILYTENETSSQYVKFDNMISLIDTLEYVYNNEDIVQQNLLSLKNEFMLNSNYDLTIGLLNKLNFDKEAQTLTNIKEDIIQC